MDVAMTELGDCSFAEQAHEHFLARSQDNCFPMIMEELGRDREHCQASSDSQGLSCSGPLLRDHGAAACAAPAAMGTGFRDMPRHKPRQQAPLRRARTHEEPLLRQVLLHLHLKRQEEEHRMLARFHQQQQQQQEQEKQKEKEQQQEQEHLEQERQEQIFWHLEREQQRLEGVPEHPIWEEPADTREQEDGPPEWREMPNAIEGQDQPCTEGPVLEQPEATMSVEQQSLVNPCWEQSMHGTEEDLAAIDIFSCSPARPLPCQGQGIPFHVDSPSGGFPKAAHHLSVCRGLWSHQGHQQGQALERAQSLPASYWGPTFLGEQGQSVARHALYSLPGSGGGAAHKLQEVSLPLCFLPNYWDDQPWRLELPEDECEEEHLSLYLPQLGLF